MKREFDRQPACHNRPSMVLSITEPIEEKKAV
jgi:hypothetical protein